MAEGRHVAMNHVKDLSSEQFSGKFTDVEVSFGAKMLLWRLKNCFQSL